MNLKRMSTLPDHAHTLLTDLLSRGSVKSDRVRDITVNAKKIQGYPFEDVSVLTDFHETLKLAQKANVIQLHWLKHFENEQLDLVRLINANGLASFLKVPFRPDSVSKVIDEINNESLPSWLKEALTLIEDHWFKGKKAFSLALQDADKLKDLFQAACALGEGLPDTTPLDYRQFGARYLNDSKKTKTLENALASLYRWHMSLNVIKPSEVLSHLNLVPITQPILLRGPINFSHKDEMINCNFPPHIGVPVDYLDSLTLSNEPNYILTIENQSSFNEYTRTLDEGAIVIYTAGFPTKALQYFISILTTQLSKDTPFYHWGDTDPHGFMILKTLQDNSSLIIKPHLMDAVEGENYSKAQLKSFESMDSINDAVDALIKEKLLSKKGLIEQERLEASSPLMK